MTKPLSKKAWAQKRRQRKRVIVGIKMTEDMYGELLRLATRERRYLASFCRNVLEEYLLYVGRQERRSARREATLPHLDGLPPSPVAEIEVRA